MDRQRSAARLRSKRPCLRRALLSGEHDLSKPPRGMPGRESQHESLASWRQAVSQAKRLAQKGVPTTKQIEAPEEVSTGLSKSRFSGENARLELEGLED